MDDVALLKQGRHSVGVYRQYAGASGKLDNCQVAVDLTYAVPGKRRNADQATWPLGMRLYLPKPWVEEAEYADLREEVRVPEDVAFRTKPEIALGMIDEARSRGLPHKVIVADAGYGDRADFRKALRDRNEPYVLGATPGNLRVIDARVALDLPGQGPAGRPRESSRYPEGTRRGSPREMARRVKAWTRVEWARGTKGPLVGLFYRTRVRVTVGSEDRRHATEEVVWLLLEKRSNALKAYVCWGLDDASLDELVAYAHLRWTIEQFHREAKQVVGMDRFEGRTWAGWHHHFTMLLLAYAFLALLRVRGGRGPRPTVPQVARAIAWERGTQSLMRDHRLPRERARTYALSVLRGMTDW